MQSRPRPLAMLAALVAALVLVAAVALVQPNDRTAANVLYQSGAALDASGQISTIEPGTEPDFFTGTRVLDPGQGSDRADAAHLAEQSRQWLASGTIPGPNYQNLARTALLDLHTLTVPSGGVLAGPSAAWRYVWPRDASFAAAAYAETGHLDDAIAILDFLQQVQGDDGSFHARYLPDGSGVPDDRGLQTDGTAWALWCLQRVLVAADESATTGAVASEMPTQLRERFAPLLNRSVDYLMAQTDTPSHLPLPSSDYWERPESQVTLGTAAPVLTGLTAAERLYQRSGDEEAAARLGARAEALQHATVEAFGASGYGRYPGRNAPDPAIAFTLPPFLAEPLPGAIGAWQESIAPMQRPGGGLAPGATWAETSMSWTPETALYAWAAAANGRPEQARHWLDWIDTHRTSIGAIPEKVGPDGSPAHVAPLAWTDALVLLTLAELENPGHPGEDTTQVQ